MALFTNTDIRGNVFRAVNKQYLANLFKKVKELGGFTKDDIFEEC